MLDTPVALDAEKRLKPLLIMFSVIFFAFAIGEFIYGHTWLALSDAFVATAVLILNALLQRKLLSAIWAILGVVIMVGVGLVSELIFENAISSFIYYYGIAPFIIFYIVGKRAGILSVVVLTVMVWLVWLLSFLGFISLQYETAELFIFSVLLMFSAACAWLFESEREESHEKLQRASQRYETLINAIGEVSYRVDMQGNILEMSDALYKITGYKPSEVVNNPTINFYAYPEERQGYMDLLMKHGKVENYAITIVGKQGNHIRILMSSRFVYDKQGNPEYIEGMFRNITKEQKLEEERKAHLEHLQKLGHIEDKLANTNLETALSDVVNSLRDIFDAERAFLLPLCFLKADKEQTCYNKQFVARDKQDTFDAESFTQCEELRFFFLSLPKKERVLSQTFDDIAIFSSGLRDKFHIQSHMFMVLETSQKAYWLLGLHNLDIQPRQQNLLVDISKRVTATLNQLLLQRSLEAAAIEAEIASKAKGDFVATISHELRTPLHGIIGLLDLMGMDMNQLSQEQQKNLKLAQASAQVLRSLIDDVLDLSKIESGNIEIQKQPFDLQQAVTQALIPFVVKAKEKHIHLGLEMRKVAKVVEGDVQRLRQVLLNLVGNAIKFTMQGYVRIVVTQDESWLYINIEDSGIGIEREKQAEVFHPFTQVHHEEVLGDNLQEKGTGLGTTISQYFVKMMGGTLTLQSEPDVGSTMTICLPLQQVGDELVSVHVQMEDLIQQPVLDTMPAEQRITPAKNKVWRVLLAEDDPVGRRVAVKRLQRAGFDVQTAGDGKKAYEMWKVGTFDLLLTDVRMPGLSGLDLTRQIRVDEQASNKPPIIIVGLSAYALEDVKADALASGMDAFIAKPVDMQALLNILEEKCAV